MEQDGEGFAHSRSWRPVSLSLQNCSVNVKCVNIRCPLQGLDSKAALVLRSRLWNGTFLEVWPCHEAIPWKSFATTWDICYYVTHPLSPNRNIPRWTTWTFSCELTLKWLLLLGISSCHMQALRWEVPSFALAQGQFVFLSLCPQPGIMLFSVHVLEVLFSQLEGSR